MILLTTLLGVRPGQVRAAGFVVNSNWDGAGAGDADVSDDVCSDSYGFCTLRAAIEQANARTGIDAITFATPMTITIDAGTGALPAITDQVTIDASGEAAAGRPGVIIDGDGGNFVGLWVKANACEIYGLHLTNFGRDGIQICSATNKVGSANPVQRNVVSGNGRSGIDLYGSPAHHNDIQNNWIGVGSDGQTAVPNLVGVLVENGAHDNFIGGETAGTGNHISGNLGPGVCITGSSHNNRLGDNVIGLTPVNDLPLGNGGNGVLMDAGPQYTTIGVTPARPNTIVHNGWHGIYIRNARDSMVLNNVVSDNAGDGVHVDGATALGNEILMNSIYDNDSKGIMLSNGSNAGLAPPVVTAASPSLAWGAACAGCRVELYSDDQDEGEIYEGFVMANSSGNWTYTGALNGPYVTATNTDASSNTSEFSAPRPIGVCGGPIPLTCGQQVNGDTTGYPNGCQVYDCSTWPSPESGPEVIYSLSLPAGGPHAFTATLSNMSADLDVFVLSSSGCSSGQCLSTGSYGDQTVEVENVTGGLYYIAVEGYNGAAGSYTLDVACNIEHLIYQPLVLHD
jgi:parallel beta-helix repeat protein